MTLDAVVTRVAGGNLLDNLRQINISSWQTSKEVWTIWKNCTLIEGTNTANIGIYRLVQGLPVFELLGKGGNPFVHERFREEAYQGILGNPFFFPQGEMKKNIMAAIHAGASIPVHYSQLRLKTEKCSSNHGYIEVDSSNSDEEKKLFKGVYGTERLSNKRVYLLRKDIVEKHLRGKTDEVIMRACYFLSTQYFLAIDRDFLGHFSAVYGTLRGNETQRESAIETPMPTSLDSTPVAITSTDVIAYLKAHPVADEKLASVLLDAANTFYKSKVTQ